MGHTPRQMVEPWADFHDWSFRGKISGDKLTPTLKMFKIALCLSDSWLKDCSAGCLSEDCCVPWNATSGLWAPHNPIFAAKHWVPTVAAEAEMKGLYISMCIFRTRPPQHPQGHVRQTCPLERCRFRAALLQRALLSRLGLFPKAKVPYLAFRGSSL